MIALADLLQRRPAPTRVDPTRTTTIRRQFQAQANRRFRAFKTLLREALLDHDALGLAAQIADPEADRLEGFESWLLEASAKTILETSAGRVRWTDSFIAQAAAVAARQADADLRRIGLDPQGDWYARGGEIAAANGRAAEVRQIQDRVRTHQHAAWSDLRGIRDAMVQQMMREAAQGLREQAAPAAAYRRLADRVDKVGGSRARVLAHTAPIATHADVTLDRYAAMGIEEVEAQVEFVTRQDGRVCPVCEALGGSTWRIEAARGLIPVHPRCRCRWQLSSREPPPRAPESQPYDVPRPERIDPPERRISERRRIIEERLRSPEERRIREWLDSVRERIPDDPDQRVRRLMDNWVRGSGRKVSVEMKEAAIREFGLVGIAYSRVPYRIREANIRQTQADLRRIYRDTQAWFRAQGITEVTLYRGVKSGVRVPGALESWTTNRAVAEAFDGYDVLKEVIPVERILFVDGGPHFVRGPYGAQFEMGVLSSVPTF